MWLYSPVSDRVRNTEDRFSCEVTLSHTHNLKFNNGAISPNDAIGNVNSEDPDQTAPLEYEYLAPLDKKVNFMSHVRENLLSALWENNRADQLRGYSAFDQRLCFTLHR